MFDNRQQATALHCRVRLSTLSTNRWATEFCQVDSVFSIRLENLNFNWSVRHFVSLYRYGRKVSFDLAKLLWTFSIDLQKSSWGGKVLGRDIGLRGSGSVESSQIHSQCLQFSFLWYFWETVRSIPRDLPERYRQSGAEALASVHVPWRGWYSPSEVGGVH